MLYIPTPNDIIAALSMLADVIGEGLVGVSLGWAARPTGIGFIIGFVFLLGFRTVAPVSFEVESLTIVSRIAKKQWFIMIYAVMLAGIIGAILGGIGAYSTIVKFIGPAVQFGMLTGVGIILSIVAIDLIKENRVIGIVSAGSAFIIYLATVSDPSALIYALAGSVVISVIVGRFRQFDPILPDMRREKIMLVLPWRQLGQFFRGYQTYEGEIPAVGNGSTNGSNTGGTGQKTKVIKKLTRANKIMIVRAALALLALRTGTSIAYPSID